MAVVGTGAIRAPLVIGRYALFDEVAAGGAATVHLGRLLGADGRTVAIKRLHSHYLKDDEFVAMFMDEARIVARIPKHPNVVSMIDLVRTDDGLFLVIDYVHGESLSRLLRATREANGRIPLTVVGAVVSGALRGLHVAHETKGRDGKLLDIVHRDVSPQNIMIGTDGVSRVLDFGIAKAIGRSQTTREGQIKGKVAYMAPEQIRGQVDRRTDVFGAAVVLWEMLAGRRMHGGVKDFEIVSRVIKGKVEPPSKFAAELTAAIDALVLKGVAVDPQKRYSTAREFADDVEQTLGLASASEVSEWVQGLAGEMIAAKASLVAAMELASGDVEEDEFVAVEETSRRAPLSLPRTPPAAVAADRQLLSLPLPPPIAVLDDLPATLPPAPTPAAIEPETVQAPSDTSRTAPAFERSTLIMAGFAVTVVLAVTGGALGAYAIYARSNAKSERSLGDPTTATAPVEHPALPFRSSAAPGPVPSAIAKAPPSASAPASESEPPPMSFSANPSMVPTPLAVPNPTR